MSVVEPLFEGETAAPSQRGLFALSWLNFFLCGTEGGTDTHYGAEHALGEIEASSCLASHRQ